MHYISKPKNWYWVVVSLLVVVSIFISSGCSAYVTKIKEKQPTTSAQEQNWTSLPDITATTERIPHSTSTSTLTATGTPDSTVATTMLLPSPSAPETPTHTAVMDFSGPVLFLARKEPNLDQDFIWILFPGEERFWTHEAIHGSEFGGPPKWSLNKRKIAYTLINDSTVSLHLLDSDSQTTRLLSEEMTRLVGDPPGETELHIIGWSPDNQWLGYNVSFPGTAASYLLNIETGNKLEISPQARLLNWANDDSGRFAYFDDWSKLYIGSIDHPSPLQAVESPAYSIISVDWHPSKNQLLIGTADTLDAGNKLWIYDIDDSSWTLLEEINVLDAKWSPEGKRIAVFTGDSIQVLDTESLAVDYVLPASFEIFGVQWLDEQHFVTETRDNLLVTPVDSQEGNFYAIEEHNEAYKQMRFVRYIDW